MSHPVECPVDLFGFREYRFLRENEKCYHYFSSALIMKKHLLGVKLVQADLPDDAKYQQTKTDAQPTV